MEEASWELAASIQSKFPNFFLEVKANFRDDGIDRNQSQSNTSQRTYHGYTEAYRGSLQRKLKEEEWKGQIIIEWKLAYNDPTKKLHVLDAVLMVIIVEDALIVVFHQDKKVKTYCWRRQ